MSPHTPFINEFGRLRSGWRIIIFTFVFIGGVYLSDMLLLRINWMEISHGSSLLDLVRRLFFLVSALVSGYLCANILEGLPWRSLGLSFNTFWFRHWLLG